jgi:hypothetical protein
MTTFKVPVVTNIQLFKYIEVQADSKDDARAIAEKFIMLAENDDQSDHPIVAGLTDEAVQKAVDGLQPSDLTASDLEWTPGVSAAFARVIVDPDSAIIEVKESALSSDGGTGVGILVQ